MYKNRYLEVNVLAILGHPVGYKGDKNLKIFIYSLLGSTLYVIVSMFLHNDKNMLHAKETSMK